MERTPPFDSREVRWFFDGGTDQHELLKHCFETVAPIPKSPDVGPPVWQGGLEGQPDIYRIIPGSDDMGIKWREGQFQIKGLVSTLGTQSFCGRHRAAVESWVKGSYQNMPTAYKNLFLSVSVGSFSAAYHEFLSVSFLEKSYISANIVSKGGSVVN